MQITRALTVLFWRFANRARVKSDPGGSMWPPLFRCTLGACALHAGRSMLSRPARCLGAARDKRRQVASFSPFPPSISSSESSSFLSQCRISRVAGSDWIASRPPSPFPLPSCRSGKGHWNKFSQVTPLHLGCDHRVSYDVSAMPCPGLVFRWNQTSQPRSVASMNVGLTTFFPPSFSFVFKPSYPHPRNKSYHNSPRD